jgi:hypothetical protein
LEWILEALGVYFLEEQFMLNEVEFQMAPSRLPVIALVAVLGLVCLAPSALAAKSVIPAYFYPGSAWNAFMSSSAAAKTHSIVANPNNGPGSSIDSNYKSYIAKAQAAGVKVLGYVATTWGARATSAVNADIDRWYSWYKVDGIFFDEGAVTSNKVSYYQTITNYVKSKSSKNFVMINPGTYYQTSAYVNIADSHMVWENAYSAYTSFSMPTWVRNYPAEKFCHVVHSTPSSKMANAISLAKSRNVGYLFVTDDVMVNPYDRMPAYWTSFVSAL